MKKFLSVSLVGIMALLLIAGCKRKEQQPVPRAPVSQGPIIETPITSPHKTEIKRVPLKVVVPPEVKSKWSAVKLLVEDRKLDTTHEFTVNLGSELKIPDSRLTVKIRDFLPDFKVSGGTITSVSDVPNNPTVGVTIYEDSRQIFPKAGEWGWLYGKYPDIHPFEHERFGIILKEGIKKQ